MSNKDLMLTTEKPTPWWRLRLQHFFAQPATEIIIGLLVIVSVGLTLVELWLEGQLARGETVVQSVWGPLDRTSLKWMTAVSDLITAIFVAELTLRFLAANSKAYYFREFWLDILATIPLFRIFRSYRALRLLRLVRLVRLLGIMSRLSSHFPYVFRRGAIEFVRICGLLFVAVLFGTTAMMYFEREPANVQTAAIAVLDDGSQTEDQDDGFGDMEKSFWFSLYTLFAGEPIPNTPRTLVGKTVTVFLMFMGLTIFAIFAGTVSAFMVDRLRVEGRVVNWDELSDHIILCGWTPKTEIIIREYRHNSSTRRTPIVVITELEPEKYEADARSLPNVYFVNDDFTKVSALKRAGIDRAQTCIVLSDTTGGRSEQDADARTILAALTVEKINEQVYTCAELINRNYASHLAMGKVNEFVISDEYGAYMIAQAGMHRGLIDVLGELLSYQHGNEFFRVPIPASWVGCKFDDKLAELKQEQNAILVAVHAESDGGTVNPKDYRFQAGDEVVAIAQGRLKLN